MKESAALAPLRKAVNQAARPIAVIGAVGGFIGDIIQPLGNFAIWIAIGSFVGAVLALIWIIVLRRRAGQEIWDSLAAGLFVLCVGSGVVFTAWAIIFAVGPERGYLATNIPPVADLQAQLLGLQKDVTAIKETTQVTATRVAEQGNVQNAQATRQAEGVSIQAAAATAQARGFADLQAQFASLQKGGLVENPGTPQEWYSNARLYELKGDSTNALKAYEGYLQYNLDFIDPYLAYSDLLKATEGIARARDKLEAYYNAHKDSPTLDLAAARLLDTPAERLARYQALAARAPQFGPVYDELGAEYNRAFGASPTADLIKKQEDAYGTLFQLEQATQGYTRYFIDKTLAEKNLDAAHQRADAFASARNVMGKVDVTVTQYNDGMQFIVTVIDSGIKKILFDIDNPKPTRETGTLSLGGTTVPNPTIERVPATVGKHTLYVQYLDANNTPSQVFNKEFIVRQVFANFTQQPLDFTTNTYSATFLVGKAGAPADRILTYKWSIDSDTLDSTMQGGGLAALQVQGLKPGAHVLYLQALDGQNKTTVEQIPFTVK